MNPLISVVIPTYRRELKYIQRSVGSVINQTYTNWEIIIVDDNSEYPEYRSIVENFVSGLKSSKIHLFKNEKNLGGSLTRNRGIDEAKGEYISFLDDDDAYLPNRLQDMLDFMIENDCDMAFTNLLMRNNDGKIVDVRDHSGIEGFDNDYLLKYHLTKNISGTSSFMYRTESIRKIGGLKDAKMGQDFYLMIRTIKGGLKVRFFNSNSVIIYKHYDGGISQGKNKIVGEKNLYKYKKQYFDSLDRKSISFIKFRHYAVMVVAYMRNKKYLSMLLNGLIAFFVSPSDFVNEVSRFVKNVRKYRKNDIILPMPEDEKEAIEREIEKAETAIK